jgi:mannose-1-phosphate guanylyltransferase
MLQATVSRLAPLVSLADVYVVTGERYMDLVKRQLPELPSSNILVEPYGRDTAPCIGLATVFLRQIFASQDPVTMVLPSDHLISDLPAFHRALSLARDLALQEEVLVCIGLRPTRPETGYGYIKCGEALKATEGCTRAYRVERFTEKPNLETAKRFLEQGGYLWNSGMFVWRLSNIEKAMARHMPELAAGLLQLAKRLEKGEPWLDVFAGLPRISIDYGVMEKASNVVVVEGEFQWDDVGTWSALSRVYEADEMGNVVARNGPSDHSTEAVAPILLNSRGCVVYNGNRLLVVVGADDLIIVDTDDALLVCKKQEEQRLKELLSRLREGGLEQYL